jgi:hypothetical protein
MTPMDAGAASNSVGIFVFLAIGALGGAHCLGMCGPLVSLYAERLGTDETRIRWRDVQQQLLFNFGRTVSYAAIGALMGFLGSLLYDAAAITTLAQQIRATSGLVIGALVIGTGLSYTLAGGVSSHGSVPGFLSVPFSLVSDRLTEHVDSWVNGPRIVALGAVHGILPCPLLYPVFLYAFAGGSPVTGFVSLGALGLGTIPTLLAYGTLFQSLGGDSRQTLHRALGVMFVIMGYVPFSHGLRLVGIGAPPLPIPFYQPLM